jgi:hypothetical protein
MAQTIAMQRGTGSLSASGNTSATLFLQSGGSATRVIVNGIAWYSAGSNSMYMSLYVDSSGGPGYIVGRFYQYSQSGQFTVSPSNGMGTVGWGSGALDCSSQLYTSGGSTWPAFSSPSSVNVNHGGQSSVMQNFWIGPGDSVVLRANNGGTAQSYGFSFTTITES